MKRLIFPLLCIILVVTIYFTEGFKGWFDSGPPKVAEQLNDVAAIEKSWRIDTQTKQKISSLLVPIRIETARRCNPSQFGYIDATGRVLTLCPRITQLQQSVEIAHLVDHALRMSQPQMANQKQNDAYALLAECVALRELVFDGDAHFPICRASREEVINGKYALANPLNKVLERLPLLETTISAKPTP